MAWNRTLDRPLSFSTQATVQIGADEELLRLLADARFSVIFLGLETLRKECLDEVNKGQMARFDPRAVIPAISSHGIMPFLGMIVGFDHDTPAVFGEIESFLDETGSPIASISVLNAPRHTELYRRMQAEGRLQEEFRGFWHLTTNIVPKGMTLSELYEGHKALFQRLYEPERFERRMIRWLGNVRYLTEHLLDAKEDPVPAVPDPAGRAPLPLPRAPAGAPHVLERREVRLADQSAARLARGVRAGAVLALLRLRAEGGVEEGGAGGGTEPSNPGTRKMAPPLALGRAGGQTARGSQMSHLIA